MVEGSALAAVLVGLAGLEVVSAGEVGAEVWVVVQSPQRQSAGWCSSCGVRAASHGRRVVRLRDVPCGGRPAVVVWRKRLWRCREPLCPRRTWSETHPGLPSRRVLTARAAEEIAAWLSAAVPVAAVAARFGVAWGTAWAAFTSRAAPAVAAAHEELPPPAALGVDETTFLRSGRRRFGDRWCTSVVDLSEGRLLDVVPGRSGGVIRGWVADRETRDPGWAARVSATVCDPLRAYARGLRTALPDAALVIDAYHVTRLGLDTLDEVRQHVSRELAPRRPRKGDVLYDCRRRLRTAPERLTAQTLARLREAVNRADPSGAVWLAWRLAHELRRLGQVATAAVPAAASTRSSPRPLRRDDPSFGGSRRAHRVARPDLREVRQRPGHQRRDRSDQHPDQEDQADRPRLPQLRELPTAAAHHLGQDHYGQDSHAHRSSTPHHASLRSAALRDRPHGLHEGRRRHHPERCRRSSRTRDNGNCWIKLSGPYRIAMASRFPRCTNLAALSSAPAPTACSGVPTGRTFPTGSATPASCSACLPAGLLIRPTAQRSWSTPLITSSSRTQPRTSRPTTSASETWGLAHFRKLDPSCVLLDEAISASAQKTNELIEAGVGAGRGWLHDPGSRPPPSWRAREPPTPFRPNAWRPLCRSTTTAASNLDLAGGDQRVPSHAGRRRSADARRQHSRGGPSARVPSTSGTSNGQAPANRAADTDTRSSVAIDRRGAPCDAPTSAPSCPSSRRW